MWVNAMLTIWLYGTLFGIVMIIMTLSIWYRRED